MRSDARGTLRRRGVRGFGLLEAIVALALLGSSGLILFAWIQSNLEATQRLREAEQRARLQLEAQAWVQLLNPAREPQGEVQLNGVRLRWRSELVEPMRSSLGYGELLVARWRVGLYRVHLEAEQQGVTARWEQWANGWLPTGAPP